MTELLDDGYSFIAIPDEVFGPELVAFARAIVHSVLEMAPATNPMMKAVYRMLARLADDRVKASPECIVLGLLLASAALHGEKIETHPRDLAKEVKVRYATLLKVRRTALLELKAAA